jgi:GMP synthase-like glutamine amidotransferase
MSRAAGSRRVLKEATAARRPVSEKRTSAVPRVLILQHVGWEGPGIIGEALEGAGASVRVIELHRGQKVPIMEVEDGEFDCVFCLGSPSTAYRPETNPNHDSEIALMKTLRRKRVPSFNICYSMQLFCVANGGVVAKNVEGKEVGFHDLTLTPQGRRDPVAGHVTGMLQWHGDIVRELPSGSVLLASSELTENQIAVVDGVHYLVQGDGQAARPATLRNWFREDGKWARGGLKTSERSVIESAEANESKNVREYVSMVRGFLDLAMARELQRRKAR